MERQTDVDRIVDRAQEIYDLNFREEYEANHGGRFVVIDIRGGNAYLGQYAEEALQKARKEAPYGVFHLIRVGHPGAFRIRHATSEAPVNYW